MNTMVFSWLWPYNEVQDFTFAASYDNERPRALLLCDSMSLHFDLGIVPGPKTNLACKPNGTCKV